MENLVTKVESKRQAILTISSEVFLGLIKSMDGTKKLKVTGLPQDAVLINVRHNLDKDQVDLLLESKEFELVNENQCFPKLNLFIEEEKVNYTYDPITTCIKCNVEFYGMAGLHGYKLCNDCTVSIGQIASNQIEHIKKSSGMKSLSWLQETKGSFMPSCSEESTQKSKEIIDYKYANREQLKLQMEETAKKLQDLANKTKILIEKNKSNLEKLVNLSKSENIRHKVEFDNVCIKESLVTKQNPFYKSEE